MHPVIRDVAAALGDKAKVIKIDVDKNQELADALHQGLTYVDDLQTRPNDLEQSGELDANTIINIVQEQL
jgi:thioredoxin 1